MLTRRSFCIALLAAGLPLAGLSLAGLPIGPAFALSPSAEAAREGRRLGKTFKVDRVLVFKGKRQIHLMFRGRIVRTYKIGLGFNPKGHKLKEGDGRTPEGLYRITLRNARSRFHLSLKISYPDRRDRARARRRGDNPGGQIFIHGQPNGAGDGGRIAGDWTLGCIAVGNAEIREIWRSVRSGTIIEIRA